MMTIRLMLALLLTWTLPAAAAEHRMPVGSDITLQLAVPDAWHGTNMETDLSTTAIFVPSAGNLKLMLTAIDSTQTRSLPQAPDDIRTSVASAAHDALAHAAERTLPVQDLVGAHVQGAWFSATDRAAELPAGEYRYMTQGELSVDGTTAVFTLLVNAADAAAAAKVRDEALAALETLRQVD